MAEAALVPTFNNQMAFSCAGCGHNVYVGLDCLQSWGVCSMTDHLFHKMAVESLDGN